MAVIAVIPRQAPASKLMLPGNGVACTAGKTIYSAAVPKARFHCPFQTQTRSPMRDFDTPSPTSSITPAPSLCGITREGYFASETLARLDVRRIDARGGEFDAHFTRSGTRCLNFADLQYFACGAVALIVSGLHWPDPLDRHDSMMRPSANRAKNRKSVARNPSRPSLEALRRA